ncbi:MAG: hypothetical protein AAFS12_08550 [Cyanobacteria bacterium J06632_19]
MDFNNAESKEKVNSQVSEETETVVENNIPNASETIKQKTIEIMDAIKRKQQ